MIPMTEGQEDEDRVMLGWNLVEDMDNLSKMIK